MSPSTSSVAVAPCSSMASPTLINVRLSPINVITGAVVSCNSLGILLESLSLVQAIPDNARIISSSEIQGAIFMCFFIMI